MKNMRNLIQLDIHSCYELICMPAGIGELSHLRTLPIFVLGENSRCTLGELGGLDIEGVLDTRHLENMMNAMEARQANLNEKQDILSLNLSWGLNAYYKRSHACEGSDDRQENFIETLMAQDLDDDDSISAEDVLDALQPHVSLGKLSIRGYIGRRLPCWLMESSLPKLVSLALTSCIRCEQLPAFGQMPFLKVLTPHILPAVKTLSSELYSGDSAFPLLEELKLAFMPELEEWSAQSEGELFPCLVNLSLKTCPKLKQLPSTFASVRRLEMDVDDDLMLNSLQNGAFPNLNHLGITNCNEETMPEVLTQRMSSLTSWSMTRTLRDCSSSASATALSRCSSASAATECESNPPTRIVTEHRLK